MEDIVTGTLAQYLAVLGVVSLASIALGITIGAALTAHRVEEGEKAAYQKGKDDRDAERIAQMQERSRCIAFDLGDGVVGLVRPAPRAAADAPVPAPDAADYDERLFALVAGTDEVAFDMGHLRGLRGGVTA